MKKKFLSASIALATAALSLTFNACSVFEGNGFEDKEIGNLEGVLADRDLPTGYRIKSVGDIRYVYSAKGFLEGIRIRDVEFNTSKKKASIETDEGTWTYTLTFNSHNLLTKVKETLSSNDDDSYKGEGSYELSYNSDQQLTSLSGSYTESFVEEETKHKISSKAIYDFTYDFMRLKRVKLKVEEKETVGDQTEKENFNATIGFNYEDGDNSLNRYYQWTPNVVAYALFADDDSFLAAMAYVGLLGRASSVLPESIDIEKKDESTTTKNCSYSFNTYNALKKADGITYSYTEKEDDYEVKPFIGVETRSVQPVRRHPFFGNLFLSK